MEIVEKKGRKRNALTRVEPAMNSINGDPNQGIQNTRKKWTMPIKNCSLTISQLAIFFEGWLDKELSIC